MLGTDRLSRTFWDTTGIRICWTADGNWGARIGETANGDSEIAIVEAADGKSYGIMKSRRG